uniref:Uncharacterized protein n=1 Tax=Hemiselmis andersenii TaxID=464988 RepID=A0A6U4Q3F8_HEMAN|mmetsp:Transcript_26130/g.60616  ORF Transcript_26130/g.60616 Transcript_26130/m.60616 type:complete len:117 (+) Transcript_26130:38-388(+)
MVLAFFGTEKAPVHLGGGMRIENFDELSVILFAVGMGAVSLIFSVAALVIALISLNHVTHPLKGTDDQFTRTPSAEEKKQQAQISRESKEKAREAMQQQGSSAKRVLQPAPLKDPL